ncbi:MAG: hypothetical protein K8I27_12000 [Planctomycetes bacterium]|nr:hypothetical protein [Planctomycetota bacterium]
MDFDGTTPWGLILTMFAYAFIGWTFLFAIHYRLRKRRTTAATARDAALGYGDSWKSSRASDY